MSMSVAPTFSASSTRESGISCCTSALVVVLPAPWVPLSHTITELNASAVRAAETTRPSEPEASQAAWLRRQGYDRRAWFNAIHVPRRWSLRRCVERGSDARPAVVEFGRPAVVRPRLRNTRQCARLGHSRSVALDYDVRVADRHRDRTSGIARDIAPLARACARLEPER